MNKSRSDDAVTHGTPSRSSFGHVDLADIDAIGIGGRLESEMLVVHHQFLSRLGLLLLLADIDSSRRRRGVRRHRGRRLSATFRGRRRTGEILNEERGVLTRSRGCTSRAVECNRLVRISDRFSRNSRMKSLTDRDSPKYPIT